MEWMDFLRVYGPLSLGWVLAAYLVKFILDRYASDIDAKVKLAGALDNLSRVIDQNNHKA